MNLIDPTTLAMVSRALDAGSLRHQAIAQNIANANVPGAQAVRVQFEEMLDSVRASLEGGQAVSMADIPEPQMVKLSGADSKIELDKEMSALSSNSIQYQALLRAIDRQLGMVSIAIQDGRR